MKKCSTGIVLLLLLSVAAVAQDTLLLINGQYKFVKVRELNPVDEYLVYSITSGNKEKFKALDTKEVFSIAYKDSVELIIYEQDTVLGLELSVEQMERFIRGEQFALENYKAPWVTVGGVAAGVAGPLTLRVFLGLLVPTAYCGVIGVSKVHIKKQQAKYPELFQDELFVAGYKDRAKHKKMKNAIWGSLAGLGAGILTYGIISVVK